MKSTLFLTGALALLSSQASAHAFAQRYDLPLPLWYYVVGAGAAVALSFVVAIIAGSESKPARFLAIPLPQRIVDGTQRALGTFAIASFILLLAAGLFGSRQDWDSNLLPVSVWVIWWVGLTFFSALFGGVWPLIDPWRAVAHSLPFGQARFDWPRCISAWPAVLLFLGFIWCELVWTENAVPDKLVMLILGYSIFTWTGMVIFGVEPWRSNADPFARFFGLFARFAPLDVKNGRLILRWFGAGLRPERTPLTAEAAFVIVVLAAVSFDGISETPFWADTVGFSMRILYDAGIVALLGYTAAESLVKTLGLLATPVLFGIIYFAVCAIVGHIAGETAGHTARRYVLSLAPIAIGYHLSHYFSYLLIQGQAVLPLLSDPLDFGWDLFGTRDYRLDIGIVDMRFVWLFAIFAIVAGHIAAVWLAHSEALREATDHRTAIRSQVPMLVLMVAYTMLSLWILSQPIVEV